MAVLEGGEAARPERRQAQGTVVQRIDVVRVVAMEVEPRAHRLVAVWAEALLLLVALL